MYTRNEKLQNRTERLSNTLAMRSTEVYTNQLEVLGRLWDLNVFVCLRVCLERMADFLKTRTSEITFHLYPPSSSSENVDNRQTKQKK